jgi:hypothetical protein
MRRLIVLVAAVSVGGYFLWPLAFTVVPTEQAGSLDDVFDPVAVVDGVWEDINASARNDAVDLGALLDAIGPDSSGLVDKDHLTTTTEEFGLITSGEAHVYLVKTSGTVTAASTDSSVGTMTVALDEYAGSVEVDVYIGPRIPSDDSSIRDAVGTISFGDFRDQTEFGKVASEINSRVAAMLATVDPASLIGQHVTVYGAMTIRTFNLVQIDVSTVHVVPIAVDVG